MLVQRFRENRDEEFLEFVLGPKFRIIPKTNPRVPQPQPQEHHDEEPIPIDLHDDEADNVPRYVINTLAWEKSVERQTSEVRTQHLVVIFIGSLPKVLRKPRGDNELAEKTTGCGLVK